MLAGFAEVEFTPKEGNMPGGMTPEYAVGTLGGLYANAAAFTSGDNSVILVSTDTLSFHKEYGDDIRKRISEATGVSVKNILVASIHSHTSTSVEYQLWLCPPDLEVAKNTADKTVEAAVAAWNNRAEAKLGVGRTYESRFSYCRDFYLDDGSVGMNPWAAAKNGALVRPAGQVDHSVNVMRVDGEDGKIKCFIVNYANHPDCHIQSDKNKFSADFPGFMRRALKRKYGDDVTVLFFNGTAGDINCIDFANGFHKNYYCKGKVAPEIIGEGLAEKIIELNDRLFATETDPLILTRDALYPVPRRKKTEEMVEWAKEIAKDLDSAPEDDRAFATEYLEEDGDTADTVDIEIHTIQIGPWAIVGLPSEIFTEIGLKIKAHSPYVNTCVFELANGTNGYIAPDRIIGSGAYETKYSKYNSFVDKGAADVIISNSLRMLDAMAFDRDIKGFEVK